MAFLPLLSAGLSVLGGIKAKNDAAAEANARTKLGIVEAEDRRRQTQRLIASQHVAFAAAGVDPAVGSPLDVLGDTVAEEELAALRIRFGRNREAEAIKRRGDAALIQGFAGGANTILGSLGDIA